MRDMRVIKGYLGGNRWEWHLVEIIEKGGKCRNDWTEILTRVLNMMMICLCDTFVATFAWYSHYSSCMISIFFTWFHLSLTLSQNSLHTFPPNILDIEEITHKAGNYKKFSVFTRMLGAALTEEKDSVLYVDLLTSSDLELLKARKSGGISNPSSQAAISNKRYVILTYSGKEERERLRWRESKTQMVRE